MNGPWEYQVLTALRLYLKDTLSRLVARSAQSASALLELAKKGERVVLPGYTHLQRAVPQTLGHWAAGFAEGMIESGFAIADARDRSDRSPLGAAAGYGVNLPLDREGVAHELGFEEIDINPLWSQTSRGLLEIVALSAVFHASALVRRLAWDLSLFTTAEFGFVKLPDELTTGSSIMPNKRNPDVVELMRGSASIVQGALTELMSLVSLPSGYHRDLQLMKAPLMRALSEADATLSLVPKLVSELRFDEKKMAAAVTEDTLATDQAVDLARGGMPFRDAYKRIAASGLSGDAPVRLLRQPRSRSHRRAPRATRRAAQQVAQVGMGAALTSEHVTSHRERARASHHRVRQRRRASLGAGGAHRAAGGGGGARRRRATFQQADGVRAESRRQLERLAALRQRPPSAEA